MYKWKAMRERPIPDRRRVAASWFDQLLSNLLISTRSRTISVTRDTGIRSWLIESRSRIVTVSSSSVLMVDGDAIGCTDGVHAAVAPADGVLFLIMGIELVTKCVENVLGRLGQAVLAHQG